MNSFGHIFRLTTFGESHGPAIGGVVDGMPAGIDIDTAFIQAELNRRRPGQSHITTGRQEKDSVELLSGIFEGKSTGTSIGFVVRNEDQHSTDYDNMRSLFRPSHADYTYQQKYGLRDHRGGGRSSARITISRVVAGALAKLALQRLTQTEIHAFTSQVGEIAIDTDYTRYDLSAAEQNAVRCPDVEKAKAMLSMIERVKAEGDTIGGVVTCVVSGCPVGLGEPEGYKLNAALGAAMLSINAAKGFELGEGFRSARLRGSEMNDLWRVPASDGAATLTNHSGGIQGGISNGMDIVMRIAFKPVATLLRQQPAMTHDGQAVMLCARGRHDPCVVPRAVPVVEAMAAMTLLDSYLLNRTCRA
ncbi:MAG: chorismate synthase [Prevotella sp.]|nr:chorismate synthase [Prevotella sp.]